MPVIFPILIVVLAFSIAAWKLFSSLRTMQIRMGAGVVLARDENPVLFWSVAAIQCAVIGILLASVGWVIFVLPNEAMP